MPRTRKREKGKVYPEKWLQNLIFIILAVSCEISKIVYVWIRADNHFRLSDEKSSSLIALIASITSCLIEIDYKKWLGK